MKDRIFVEKPSRGARNFILIQQMFPFLSAVIV
jgi:hypothetical protein